MLEIKELTVRTKKGKIILDQVNVTLQVGVCTGLTGPSGSGKTTLLKSLLGVLDINVGIDYGEIRMDTINILQMTHKERRNLGGITFGFIPQNPMTAFNIHVPVGVQMTETFCKRLGMVKKDARQLSMDCLEKTNLLDVTRIYAAFPNQLSGGMLQRVTMAILIGLNPTYIFADEPTSALDEENKQFIIAELNKLKKSAAILFVSHDDTAIKTLCDELLVMEKGVIIERGKTKSLFSQPKMEWTREFVELAHEQKGGDWEWNKYQ